MIRKEEFILGEKGLKLAHISDLHENDPQEALAILKEDVPDLILITGDLLERKKLKSPDQEAIFYQKDKRKYQESIIGSIARFFLKKGNRNLGHLFLLEAAKISTVIYSLGNHEAYLTKDDLRIINDNGIILLNDKDISYQKNDIFIHIGGMGSSFDEKWLKEYAKKDGYKVLLMHHPEYYQQYARNLGFDLILAGHGHGGQIRLFNQGLFAPGQGFFPKYSKGPYDNCLYVSPGLSNTMRIPRINNPKTIYYFNI
ncbi:MAG: metallophosphoesterase [Erysipelotrichaceae bacterium]|nr:metallophosphoesterase [Erysipelotrichaceae bacterium]